MSSFTKKLAVALVALGFVAQAAMAEDVLRFSWWGGDERHKPTLEAIKLFQEKNPGVTIKGEYMGWGGYPERLTTQISAGNEPDIMQINWAWIASQFSKKGDGFYDLYKAKSVMNLGAFGDALYSGVVNGKLNAVPVSFTARFYLWQVSSFKKAGIAVPKTWDELFAAGKAFETKLGKDYYPVDGQLYDVILMAHAYMVQKTGKQWIDPNRPKVAFTKADALEFVKIYKKFAETHTVTPLQYRLSVSGPEAPTEQQQEWINGHWAGNYTWDSTFNTRIKTLPKTTETEVGPFVTMRGAKASGFFARPSMMFAVSKNSKKPLIAAKFIDFMLNNPEAIKVLGTSRGAPMSKIGFDTLVKENKFKKNDLDAINQLKAAKLQAPSPYFESNKIQEHVRSIFEAVSLGKSTDEEAVNRLTTETDNILAQISK